MNLGVPGRLPAAMTSQPENRPSTAELQAGHTHSTGHWWPIDCLQSWETQLRCTE